MSNYSMMPGGFAENDEMEESAAPVAPEVQSEDPRLTAALEQQKKKELYAGMLRGFQQMLAGSASGSGFKGDYTAADILDKQAQEPLARYKEQMAAESAKRKEGREVEKLGMEKESHKSNLERNKSQLDAAQFELEGKQYDFLNKQKTDDPKSEESIFVQNRVMAKMAKIGRPADERTIRSQSANVLYKNDPELQNEFVQLLKDKNDTLNRQAEITKQDKDIDSREKIAAAENASRSEDRKAAAQEKLEINKEKIETKKEEKAKLSDKQVSELATHDKAIAALDDVITQKKNWDTGKLSMGMNKVASWIGMDDAKKTAFKSDIGEQLASYIKSISGATVSPTERAALLENVPSVYDNDKTFEAKAQALKKRLGRNRQIEVESLDKLGKNVKEFSPDSDYVMMQDPDGSPPVKIKKDQAQKYLDKGAKIVQ